MIKWIKLIVRIVKKGIFMITYVFVNYPRRHKLSRIKNYNVMKNYMNNIMKDMKIDVYCTGLENLPNEQSYMITPNHQSLMDGPIMYGLFNDPVRFVSKAELKKVPVAKHILSIIGCEYMERDNLKAEFKVMLKVRNSLQTDNVRWVIFPEGTRTKDKNFKLNPFKAGTYKFPVSINKKVVPCAIFGTERVFNSKVDLKRYPIYIHFFKPFTKEDYEKLNTQEISNMCQQMIQEKVNEFIEKDKKIIENY